MTFTKRYRPPKYIENKKIVDYLTQFDTFTFHPNLPPKNL